MGITRFTTKPISLKTLNKIGYVEFDRMGLVYDLAKQCKAGQTILYHYNIKTKRYVCSLANDVQLKKWAKIYIDKKNLKSGLNTTLQNFKRTIRAIDTDDHIFIGKNYV